MNTAVVPLSYVGIDRKISEASYFILQQHQSKWFAQNNGSPIAASVFALKIPTYLVSCVDLTRRFRCNSSTSRCHHERMIT